jgi:predicted RNase H-like HicB family nuclease
MIDLPYSLVIEATDDPGFFGFYSPDLEGFTGIGHSVEDCLYQARWGMREHVQLLEERQLPVPRENTDPIVTLRNQARPSVLGDAVAFSATSHASGDAAEIGEDRS